MAGRYTLFFGIIFFATWGFFHYYPSVDLWVSHLFYNGGDWIGKKQPFAFLREIYYRGGILVGVYAVLMALVTIKRDTHISHYFYTFFASMAVFCNMIIVNHVFKDYFGRARPFMTTEFGGDLQFSPAPFVPTGQCTTNCSFISGEASGAMIMILAFVALCGANRTAKIWVWILIFPMAYMRVMAGKHFLSDVVLSMLFTTWFYWFQLWITHKMPRDLWGSWRGIWQDFLGLFRWRKRSR